jgi:uncharacterized membrane protein
VEDEWNMSKATTGAGRGKSLKGEPTRSDIEREDRRAKENDERNKRRAGEKAERDQRRAKEEESRQRSKGKTPKSTLEKRAAREEAKKYGVDTKGMSTRELKQVVAQAREIENDVNKFVEKALDNFLFSKKGGGLTANNAPATVTRKITEDPLSNKIVLYKNKINNTNCDCQCF